MRNLVRSASIRFKRLGTYQYLLERTIMEDKMQLSLMTMIMEVVITVDSEDMEDTEATEAEEGPDLTIVMMKKKKFLIINFKCLRQFFQ